MDSAIECVSESGTPFLVPCVVGKTSDGYHTFDDLYRHRHLLFCALIEMARSRDCKAFKSRLHHDGSGYPGWFIAGLELHTGTITYHLPDSYWEDCPAEILRRAPEWDGHTPDDVCDRLLQFLRIESDVPF